MSQTPGLLVSVDGPGGVGKSAILEHLMALLAADDVPAALTGHPSAGPVGVLARSLVPVTTDGPLLACLFAADRYHHLGTVIRPQLADGTIVVCDRYTASGLVVQRSDGVDLPFLIAVNQAADIPDLAVILTADPAVIAERIAARGAHNRYQGDPLQAAAEIGFYTEAADYLTVAGATVLRIDTTHTTPDTVAATIATKIHELRGHGTGLPSAA
jgi:dTMP kinase